MKLDIQTDWILRMAEKEANGIVSAGGLLTRVEKKHGARSVSSTECAALAQLVELQRRKLRLSVEQLAEQAGVEIEEVLAIEQGNGTVDPRTVKQLSVVLKLPAEKMILLAGLDSNRDTELEKAAIRFAARSAPAMALSAEENAALEEFVKVLAN